MKIQNFVYGDIVDSQSLHGVLQNNNAIDCYGSERALECRTPFDGICERPFDQGTKYEGFHLVASNGFDMIFVHTKYPGHIQKHLGELLSQSTWNHFHVACRINNIWYPMWNFMDRSVRIVSESKPPIVYPYDLLPKYQDMQMDGSLTQVYEMVTLQLPIEIITTNTASLNVRKEPSTSSIIIDTIKSAANFSVTNVATGTVVNGNPTWYAVLGGWISGEFVKEIPTDTTDLQNQVVELRNELSIEQAKNEQFTAQVNLLEKQIADLQAQLTELQGELVTCQTSYPPDTIIYHLRRIWDLTFKRTPTKS